MAGKLAKQREGKNSLSERRGMRAVTVMYMLVKIATGTSANQRMISRRVVGSVPQI